MEGDGTPFNKPAAVVALSAAENPAAPRAGGCEISGEVTQRLRVRRVLSEGLQAALQHERQGHSGQVAPQG
jgi:hypothetical protein